MRCQEAGCVGQPRPRDRLSLWGTPELTQKACRCVLAGWMTVMRATGTAMFSMVYFILLETDRFGKLRTAFDSRPWRNRENMYLSANLPVEEKPMKSSCPFSAKAEKGTCPICSTCASRDGYHHGDPKELHHTVGIAMIE